MGYYVETSGIHGKAAELVSEHGAVVIEAPSKFAPPPDAALICVVDNGWMEAAGIMYDEREYEAFADPGDPRPKVWLTMPKATVVEMNPAAADVLA